jgi:iron complex transport system ATP-binding protein
VLDDVELDVTAGEVLGLVGPNGSGKSTLLQCINRVRTPDSGTAVVDGIDLADIDRGGIARRVGYVPQEESDTFPSTVFDTVLMGRRPHIDWQPSDEDLEVVGEIVELLGLEEYAMRALDEISGGQRQKVLIGRALAQEADVLLLDEPTSSLDLRHQLEVMDLLSNRVQRQDMAAVVAIHDLNLAARYCQKVVMLHNHEVHAAGSSEVLTPEHIRQVYNVDVTIHDVDGRRIIVPEQSAFTDDVIDATGDEERPAAANLSDGSHEERPGQNEMTTTNTARASEATTESADQTDTDR